MCTARACSSRTGRVLLAAAIAFACWAQVAAAAERYDPHLKFRTIRTAHFDIHAHQGEEALARRLAAIAERIRETSRTMMGLPRGRVQVILVDQTDLANGWATPVPYDTIEVTATPPPIGSLIGDTTDWLELVFIHEYTHILHLDRSRGFMQGLRRVFGRNPAVFPNLFLPVWQIEGLATFEESRVSGAGRVPAGDFRAIVDVAAASGRFAPIDRASGGVVDWPGGTAAYAYGAYFHQFLADRYGPERLAKLAEATSGRVPFFGAGAFKQVFGRSAPQLWNEFRESRSKIAPGDTDTRARRLTHHGFTVTAPRVAQDGTIFYAVANPHGFPALMRLSPGGQPSRVAWRALGGSTSLGQEWIVFDQLERVRSVALQSDLYAVRRDGADVRPLTRHARAADPDLSPDGRRIVCTIQATGRRALAVLDFTPALAGVPRPIAADAGGDYEGPRWSPDGSRIVASRRYQGAYELVLVEPDSSEVRVLLRRADARLVTPSWSGDGTAILFSAAVGEAPFNVFTIDVASRALRQITDTLGGAQFPELSNDGTLTYVGYTADGYDLFSLPAGPGSATTANAMSAAGSEKRADANASTPQNAPDPDTPYRPWHTLRPNSWTPVIDSDAGELVVGAATAMTDALGRHAYAVDGGWSGHRARPDWNASYVYDRWRPTLFVSYSDDTDPVRLGAVRSRELFAGALLAFRRLRATDTLLGGFDVEVDTLTCSGACRVLDARRDLRSVRTGWVHDTRRQYGYSISPAEGLALETAVESSRSAFGSDGNAGAAVIDLRGFRRAFGRHTVLAARVAGAASFGDAAVQRGFSAGGAGPSYPSFAFGRDTIGLLRGFAPDDVVGTRAAVANVDLRFPIARPQRGYKTWPFFVRAIHGAAFADAGQAWDGRFRAADIRTAVGAELSTDLILLHYVPLTVVGGAAWTRDPVADSRRAAFFARVGYAF